MSERLASSPSGPNTPTEGFREQNGPAAAVCDRIARRERMHRRQLLQIVVTLTRFIFLW